jgi:molybdopterin molybdotransferase
MISLEQALEQILKLVPPVVSESVPLTEADGRILAEQVHSPIDLPSFDNSAMDGYAVRAADVASASSQSPVKLRRCGRVAAGENYTGTVDPGTCVRLFTGSLLPKGADAVVMQEDTRLTPDSSEEVLVLDVVKPWENIRLRGEDVRSGAELAPAGVRLNPMNLSLLAATGLSFVRAGRQPLVGILATGSELREAGQSLSPGQIYESNRLGLAALVRRAGGIPKIFPLVPDALAETKLALTQAFDACDALVTSGGVSVGEMDFIKRAFEDAGGTLEFWKVAIKPGRPFVFGSCRGKLLFGLPGNPVSALVTFLLLVRPALLRWQGASSVPLPAFPAELAERLSNPGSRRHFLRVKVDTQGKVWSAGVQASHILSASAGADGLVDLPPDTTLEAGASVQVLRWD